MSNNSDKTSLGRNAVYKMILNIFNLLVPLFVGPYIAGLLNKDMYGIYNRVYAEFQIFMVIGAFGIYNYGVREISKVREDLKKTESVFTSLFVIGLAANVVVTIFYVVYFLFRSNGIDKYVYMVMIIQMIANIFYIEFVNEAVENYAFITKKTILVRLLYFIAIFAFVKKPTDVVIYSVVVSFTVFLNNFISFCYLKKRFRFSIQNLEIKRHIVPLIISLLLANVELLYTQMDKVMLSPFVNDIAVTEYTIPTMLVQMLGSIPLAFVAVSIPRLSNYVGMKDNEAYKNTLTDIIRIYMSILIPMAFGLLALSKEVMWIYTKDVYTYAFPVLALAAMSRIIFGYESIMLHLMMYVWGFERQMTLYLLYGGILNVASNFLLAATGYFSAFTALLTDVLACWFVMLLCKRYFDKTAKIKVRFVGKDIVRYLLVSAMFVPISFVVKSFGLGYWFNIIVSIVLCVGVYGVFLWVTKDPLFDTVIGIVKRGKNERGN